MRLSKVSISVLNAFNDVLPHLSAVVTAADSAKDALGFFAARVFEDYARKELVFVVLVKDGNTEMYGGHLLFDVRFPRAKVRQIFVAEPYRRLNLGKVLVDALKDQLTALQFISITARVAEDLDVANCFWESQGFYTQQITPGGARRQRTIVVRAHELKTPQLFQSSGITAADPLGLDFGRGKERPLYLLDLNVLFDLGPRRARHEQAIAVFRAERSQACSLAISEEIEIELKRTADKGKTDPMQALARALPSFPMASGEDWNRLSLELAMLLFPERESNGRLTANDVSDIKHLATAIHHRLPGLVTSDARVLSCARELRRRYGIEVVSPAAFEANQTDSQPLESFGTSLGHVLKLDVVSKTDESEIRDLLTGLNVGPADQAAHWAAVGGETSTSPRLLVRDERGLVGYLAWSRAISDGPINAYVAVSEAKVAAQDACKLMLNYLIELASKSEFVRIRLRCPRRQAVFREVAASFGFTRSSTDGDELQKVVVTRLVTEDQWSSTAQRLSIASGIGLPTEAPRFRHVDQQMPIARPDGERAYISLFTLETHLAPALLCLPGRGGVLVPLQRKFAEHLLPQSPQASLLPQARAQLLNQRHYLSGPATLRVFARGDLLLFYESGKDHGAGAVVAVARVLRSYRRSEESLVAADLMPSVLEKDRLDSIGRAKTKTVTAFDNLQRLACPVPLTYLRKLGCGEAHQLQTSRRLTSQQVQEILGKGMQ
ncbi:hypothetical protein AWB71_01159 [Caballeronia peredens]|nr:hypothetical protein AWB71_01159 [Caballeronia peredens]